MNIKAEIKDGNLVITIPVNDPPVDSKSGKSRIIASTNGNIRPGLQVDGEAVVIGLNAYVKKG